MRCKNYNILCKNQALKGWKYCIECLKHYAWLEMKKYGVDNEVYVSPTCVPLRQLKEQGFKLTLEQIGHLRKLKPDEETIFRFNPDFIKNDDDLCGSQGHCFI